MPSGGLLSRPQDAKYYDWILRDPKGSPWITFKFHYRSWENLIQLQLIPASHPRELLDSDLDLEEINEDLKAFQELLNREDEVEPEMDGVKRPDPWMSNVFDDSEEEESDEEELSQTLMSKKDNRSAFIITNDTLENIYSTKESPTESTESLPDQSTPRLAEKLNRPLPPIPPREASLKHGPTPYSSRQPLFKQHSRTSSTASHAPSITPSLRSYFERDSMSPDLEIGVASLVPAPLSNLNGMSAFFASKTRPLSPMSDKSEPESDLEPEPSPKAFPSEPPRSQGIASSPLQGMMLSPNITLRRHRKYSVASPSLKSVFHAQSPIPRGEENTPLEDKARTLSITESEWMCRTPSPVRDELDRVERIWSPPPSKSRNEAKDASCEKKTVEWRVEADSPSSVYDEDEHGRLIPGNWI